MKRQGVRDRKERLSRGCCPTNGLFMTQIGGWYQPKVGRQYTVVGCPRKNCRIRAKAFSFEGPWVLLGVNEQLDGEQV
jgi:hypothetical protein